MSFNTIKQFEQEIAEFYGAPYAIAVDSCTHGVELCLRYTKATNIHVPKHTYLSIPMLANKLGIGLEWKNEDWVDYYYVTPNVVDAAVLWQKDSYVPGTFMNVSFQFRKHLSLGRGGIILTDNAEAVGILKKMSYDGREPDVMWRDQDIDTIGYHYYMTPETADLGLKKLPDAIKNKPIQWTINDWPDVSKMKVFNNNQEIDPYLQTK
jgi:dTDP-4-amino-4,6-dideoxygalactose transaminase